MPLGLECSFVDPLDSTRSPPAIGETSFHVRRVLEGDARSWTALIDRINPLLEFQARYRLRGVLSRECDPSDLLNDVWLRAYPRLGDLRPRDGRVTPVLLRFLSRTLLNRVNELLRASMRSRLSRRHAAASDDAVPLEGHPDERQSTACGHIARSEIRTRMLAALEELDPNDQEVLVLRGIEQIPGHEVATLLGVSPGALAMRYGRAKERLRRRLPEEWLEDLIR